MNWIKSSIFITLLCLTSSCSHSGLVNQATQSFPTVQGPTSETQTQISVLVPKKLEFNGYLKDSDGKMIAPTTQKKHYRMHSDTAVIQYRFTDLKAASQYRFILLNQDQSPATERLLQTFNPDLIEFNFVVASCMDEGQGDIQRKMWKQIKDTEPEFIFLIGDNVYGDRTLKYSGIATPEILWDQYVSTFRDLDLYQYHKLIPVYTTWDDHDFGSNNANRTYPYINESAEIFNAFFPRQPISGFYFKGHGQSSYLSAYGQDFILLDSRTFRSPSTKKKKSSDVHLGKEQSYWLKRALENGSSPAWILKGDQFFGAYHPFESFEGNHPQYFKRFQTMLKNIKKPFVLISGDRHLTEIMKLSKDDVGIDTYEFTTSPLHALLSGDMSPNGWHTSDNPRATWGIDSYYNFMNFEVTRDEKIMKFKVNSVTTDKILYQQDYEVYFRDYD